MAFDWLMFLQRYNVDHVTTGHNARRGWVGVPCCWCHDDPSYHLGISLAKGIYHCWRNAAHKGSSPYRLIMALLGCSFEEAKSIYGAGDVSFVRSDDSFADDSLRRLGMTTKSVKSAAGGPLEFLPEFEPIRDTGLCRVLALTYLKDRGYSRDDALALSARYRLMFAPNGAFSYRVIIPVYVDGVLVNWTGRSVAKSEALRYKSLSTDAEKAYSQGLPPALVNIKNTLLDMDGIARGGETLVLVEGPFDAMRLGFFGERLGIRATCLFGKEASPAQLDALANLSSRYDEVVSLFDEGTDFDTFLSLPDYLKVRPLRLPRRVKDPAELSEAKFRALFGLA